MMSLNKSCILTIIKNEHEYLDEWIKYHLNIGITHIFIFEDMDSVSHKDIVDKYDDRVSLNNIEVILNECERKNVLEFKLLKNINPQLIYFKKALLYIQNTYKEYEWCFIVDNDEFITLQNIQLEDMLKKYKGYDAFVMQWKIYGANGHINKPDYSCNGIINTYTQESNYIGHSVPEWTTKTCYNLKTFKEVFFLNNHQPSDKCKWCKTDFSIDRKKIVFDTVYIRHYMTKSWEEYISKRKRGYFMGFARTIDSFFKINSDMIPQRKNLIEKLKQEVLVVLPFKQSSCQGNEIRLSLNAWRKFCQFNYYFVVIGEFDKALEKEFPWVNFIYCPTKKRKEGQYNPHLDIQHKFKIIMNMFSQIYDGFIYMSDDKYAIKPFDLNDITKIHYHSLKCIGIKNQSSDYWCHDKWKTRELLDKEKLPCINYTTHYPCYFEFSKLKEIWKKYNILNESYVFEDIYFNYFQHEEPTIDTNIRIGVSNNTNFKKDLQNAINNPNIKFIFNTVNGWCEELENDLLKIIEERKI